MYMYTSLPTIFLWHHFTQDVSTTSAAKTGILNRENTSWTDLVGMHQEISFSNKTVF